MLIYHFSEIDCIESAVDVYPCLAHGFFCYQGNTAAAATCATCLGNTSAIQYWLIPALKSYKKRIHTL